MTDKSGFTPNTNILPEPTLCLSDPAQLQSLRCHSRIPNSRSRDCIAAVMLRKRGKRKAEPQGDPNLDQGRAKRRRLREGTDMSQSSSSPSIAPSEPAQPPPAQQQPRRIAVPVSRQSHAINSGTATTTSQQKQHAGNHNSHRKKGETPRRKVRNFHGCKASQTSRCYATSGHGNSDAGSTP